MYEYIPVVLLMLSTFVLIKCSGLLFRSNRTRITRGRVADARSRENVTAAESTLIWHTLVAAPLPAGRRGRVLTRP